MDESAVFFSGRPILSDGLLFSEYLYKDHYLIELYTIIFNNQYYYLKYQYFISKLIIIIAGCYGITVVHYWGGRPFGWRDREPENGYIINS